MSTWLQLLSLCNKNKALHEKMTTLYSKSSFPYKIRSVCADWIESQNWQIDLTTEEGKFQAEWLYRELLSKILVMEEKMYTENNFELERMFDLRRAKEALTREFNGRPSHFVNEVKRLREEEETLRFSNGDNQLLHPNRPDVPKTAESNEIKQKLENLRHEYFSTENALKDLEVQQLDFLRQFSIICAQSQFLDTQLASGNLTECQRNNIINQKNHCENGKRQLISMHQEQQDAVIDTFIRLAIEEANTLHLIWHEIENWHLEQKLAITGLVQPRKGSLEILEKMCDRGGEMLFRMVQHAEQLLVIRSKMNFQDDRKKLKLQILLKELTDDYLAMHLRMSFIVEQNIPNRILKVNDGKSGPFFMAVRILGGKAFRLDFTKPRVKMALFSERDIPSCDSFSPGAGEIINGDEKAFFVHRSTGVCAAQFYGVQLHDVKRPDGGRDEKLVTDQKFAFIFFTTINVCNRTFHLKVASLPIILTTQASQEIMAKGTLIWDAAFSDKNRTCFKYRESTKWSDVAAVLSALFLRSTGQGLTEDHLSYLAKIAFRAKRSLNFSDMMISEKQLIKDKLPHCDFSFWKWFCVNLNLVKDVVKKEWNNGLIFGFISKEDVRNKLINFEPGTFLLRFSESEIEVSQRSDVSGCLTVSFVERTPATGEKKVFHVKKYLSSKEIRDRGLSNILSGMEVTDYENPLQKKSLLWYLWPKKPFEDVFPTWRPSPALDDDAYYPRVQHKIEIYLAGSPNHRQCQRGVEGVSCPPSTSAASSANTEAIDEIEEDQSQDEIVMRQLQRPEAIVRPVQPILPPEPRPTFPQLSTVGGFPNVTGPTSLEEDLSIGLEHDLGLDSDSDSVFTFDSDGDIVLRHPI